MKKLFALCGSIATMLLLTPLTILAAESGESSTATVPIWLCIPFAGLLLCIAVLHKQIKSVNSIEKGEKPAACRSRMVPVIYHSVCSDL